MPSLRAPWRMPLGHLALAIGLLAAAPATAHEGHDAPAATTQAAASPRVSAVSEQYELVGIVEGEVLVLYLDRFADNEPVTGATIEVTLGGATLKAEAQANGTYEVTSPLLKQPGNLEFVADIREGETSDLLVGSLTIPGGATASRAPTGWFAGLVDRVKHAFEDYRPSLIATGAPLVIGLVLGFVLRRRPGRAAAGLVVAAAFILGGPPAMAHEGHDHGGGGQATAGNAPQRRPDGSIFLPKPTQRLLEVRTQVVQPESAARTVQFVGRVIPDPNRSGQVQGTISGRILPINGTLPRLGQAVKAGEVLAHIQPSFQPVDAATLQQTEGDLDQQIALARSRLERLRVLADRNVVARQTLEETEIQLRGLERRRGDVDRSRIVPEPLVAPVDGVVAAVRVVAGQVVTPSDIVLQIVDPKSLWVEALVFDQTDPAGVDGATARLPDGRSLALRLMGRSRSLQQMSTLLQFEIVDPPANLSVGTPLSVIAETGQRVTAIVLPRASVAQAPNGQMVVFRHTDAETFVPRPVRIESFDAERVLVLGGIEPGERIVVRNAPLVNQVR